MHVLLAALLLATPILAAAQGTPTDTAPPAEQAPGGVVTTAPPPAPADLPPAAQPAAATEEPEKLKLLGVQLSAGAPQGLALSAVVRPVKWVRGSVGLAHNILGPGIQGSVTVLPFHFGVTPTFTLEAGKFFETDISDDVSGTFPSGLDPALRKFGYSFYSAQVGLEFGSQSHFLFFLRGGLAWVRSGLDDVRGFQEGGTTVDVTNPSLDATIPTVNLGFLLYVW